jgi:thiol-disulfide isomerase/thioredoxin
MTKAMRRLLMIGFLTACQREPAPQAITDVTQQVKHSEPVRHIDWLGAQPEIAVAPYVQTEVARAKQDGRRLLVYVGATWCEPCQRFHNAAKAGELDGEFADLRVLEFDLDRDRDRLALAGYQSELIPLLALPGPDGRGNGRGMQGSIKGEGAVAQMRPRLLELLRAPQ